MGNGECSIELVLLDAPGGSLAASVSVTVEDFEVERELNFRRDIEPILTKYGCNAGGCHGKMAGQNGFKLSLFPIKWVNTTAAPVRAVAILE